MACVGAYAPTHAIFRFSSVQAFIKKSLFISVYLR